MVHFDFLVDLPLKLYELLPLEFLDIVKTFMDHVSQKPFDLGPANFTGLVPSMKFGAPLYI